MQFSFLFLLYLRLNPCQNLYKMAENIRLCWPTRSQFTHRTATKFKTYRAIPSDRSSLWVLLPSFFPSSFFFLGHAKIKSTPTPSNGS